MIAPQCGPHRQERSPAPPRRTLAWWIATVGGIGCAPRMPGTAGTLAGCAAWALTTQLPAPTLWQALALLVVVPLGVVVSTRTERLLQRTDPHEIVIDEFVAVFITFFALPCTIRVLLIGVAANRFFDIIKPYPINRLQRLPGGWGIMADDIAAGLASAAVLRLALWFWPGLA